jgi:plasmid stability protein
MIAPWPMPQLIVRKLEASVVRRLRRRAAAAGVSVEEAHRRVLREALLGEEPSARANFVEYLQAMPEVEIPLERLRDLPRKTGF